MSSKYSVISSLLHRAKHICSNKELLEEEQMQIQASFINLYISSMGHKQNESQDQYSKKQK